MAITLRICRRILRELKRTDPEVSKRGGKGRGGEGRGGEGRGGEGRGGKGREGKGREGKGREGEGRGEEKVWLHETREGRGGKTFVEREKEYCK